MSEVNALSKIFSKGTELFSNVALCVKVICGDKISEAQLSFKIGKAILSLPDELFYLKFERFLSGANLIDDAEKAKMRAWIAKNDTKADNALRLVSCIDNAGSLKKVKYFANATRCALNYDLSLELYFRICSAIDMTTEEDLKFLADNIVKNYDKTFKQNYITQKLYSAGLMEVIDKIYDFGKHKFNSLARLVDVCAVSFANDSRYPNPKRTIDEIISDLDSQISE